MARNAKKKQDKTEKQRRSNRLIAVNFAKRKVSQIVFPSANFEKRAHIYNILSNSHKPIFLQRTLSYIKGQNVQSRRKRSEFRISTLLQRSLLQLLQSPCAGVLLSFNGFVDSFTTIKRENIGGHNDSMLLNATLFKLVTTKSRDNKTAVEEFLNFSTNIAHADEQGMIFIPLHALALIHKRDVCYKLVFSLETTRRTNAFKNLACNLRRTSKIYQGEFALNSLDILNEGRHVVKMKEGCAEWNTINGMSQSHGCNEVKVYSKLKFRLTLLENQNEPAKTINCKDYLPLQDVNNNSSLVACDSDQKLKIIYNLQDRSTLPSTANVRTLTCLWCGLNCFCNLESLMQHLQLCHANFHYKLLTTEQVNSLIIDVSVNNAENAAVDSTKAYKLDEPLRRISSTNWLVCKRRRVHILKEDKAFLELLTRQRFYHASTLQPIYPNELPVDSEAEFAEDINVHYMQEACKKQKRSLTPEEFAFMKLWNLYLRQKKRCRAYCHIRMACEEFVSKYGQEIVRQNLYFPFILHLEMLCDENLITAESAFKLICRIRAMMSDAKATDKNGLHDLNDLDNLIHVNSNLQPENYLNSSIQPKKPIRNLQLLKNKRVKSKIPQFTMTLRNKVPKNLCSVKQEPVSELTQSTKRYLTRQVKRNFMQNAALLDGNTNAQHASNTLPRSSFKKKKTNMQLSRIKQEPTENNETNKYTQNFEVDFQSIIKIERTGAAESNQFVGAHLKKEANSGPTIRRSKRLLARGGLRKRKPYEGN